VVVRSFCGQQSAPGYEDPSLELVETYVQVDWLRACMVFAGGIAIYTASQELVSPRAGSL
jgi:hypothetical protein